MRVIGGEFRRRALKSLPGLDVRPTPDRLRESLFNILAPQMDACRVFVDGYAGTGAVGIEALSRGAERAVFIERNRAAVGVLRDNLRSLGLEGRSEVFTGKSADVLARHTADIVFLDPPYPQVKEYADAMGILGARPAPLVVVQHEPKMELQAEYGMLRRFRVVRQGSNSLSFYARIEVGADDASSQMAIDVETLASE
ncbi:MAG: 16S rRNA (guanine(966)-N(2))-methyltransferase RsmD [Bryobacteraceae bacterium]